ncbi:hypothetical protein DC74_p00009 (plasmid) [Streptomyces noursei]|nr:hypothetical protein DC74_p00009 [Streptomyces noursei]
MRTSRNLTDADTPTLPNDRTPPTHPPDDEHDQEHDELQEHEHRKTVCLPTTAHLLHSAEPQVRAPG